MKIGAWLQRIFYPRTDTGELARQAVQNGAVAGWIMVAIHFVLGAFLIMLIIPEQNRISGDELIPAMLQIFLAFFYGALATYTWRKSRAAAITLLVLLILDTLLVLLRVGDLDPQVAAHLFAIILAIGGARGAIAHTARQRAGE
jgi:uncharacterized membrane protein YhaH (DUF805 family)